MLTAQHDALSGRKAPLVYDGAAALTGATGGQVEDAYVCPCCVLGFPREAVVEGVLSDDHVPSDAMGGTLLVLTCKPCNNFAGTKLDAHAVRHDNQQDFIRGTLAPDRRVKSHVRIGDLEMRVDIRQDAAERAVLMSAVAKANPPGLTDGMGDAVTTLNTGGGQFHLQLEPFRPRAARVSWLRPAYLAAFAAWGYRYIVRPPFDLLREQIHTPESDLLPNTTYYKHGGEPDANRMLRVRGPGALTESVIVTMGRWTTVLPGLNGDWSVDEAHSACHAIFGEGAAWTVEAEAVPWPTRPRYALDG